jgi:uncharacterized protein (DUF362 family)
MNIFTRRDFLKTSLLGMAAFTAAPLAAQLVPATKMTGPTSRVALTAGEDRADLTFKGLQFFSKEIAQAIGNKRVIIKPNNVSISNPLCASHADCLEGILEFLKSIKKLDNVAIAESAADGPTLDGFDNYKYTALSSKYPVKFIDLDQELVGILHVFDEKDFRPHPMRTSRLLMDPNNFIISAAKMKTHDRVVATLSLKNIVVGAPVKDLGFKWGPGAKGKSDKSITHGSGFRGINYNLFDLSRKLHPHLAVVDGFQGMQGNGPTRGTPVEHRVCVVSSDWLAADRVAIELMGIDFAKVGYLNFCAQAGLGEGDLKKIEVLGESIAPHVKQYKLSDNIEKQLIWMKPVQQG